ncbi:MAG: DUF3237 family protein [Ktedonobacterales bacterium]
MRITHLCNLSLAQRQGLLVQPYGGEEGTVFGHGEGVAEGERLHGTATWFNFAHRRSDGAMQPHLQGVITTHDGATILFELQGRVRWVASDDGLLGDQLMRVTFETADERYRWLNDAFCVFEGKLRPPQPTTGGNPQRVGSAQVYLCENELF